MKSDKPSATASLILKSVLFAAHDPKYRSLVSSETTRWSTSIARKIIRFSDLFLFAVQNTLFRWVVGKIERTFNPGFILHVAARKKFIDDLGRKSIASGISQIVAVGAGYDTLTLRTAAHFPTVHCFEVDHPSTQEAKRESLEDSQVPDNLFFVSADLSKKSIGSTLSAHPKFDSRANTLVIIEGVLMYLPVEAVRNFFKDLTDLVQGKVTCIFTFMERRPNGDIQFKTAHPWVNWWLRQKHEQFLWGIERDQLSPFLDELGFSRTMVYEKSEFIAAYFENQNPAPALAEGELIGVTSNQISPP